MTMPNTCFLLQPEFRCHQRLLSGIDSKTDGSKMPGTSPSNRIFFIDKRILFVIVTPHHDLSGRNSVVECHLAKVDVDGSNPFARSIFPQTAA